MGRAAASRSSAELGRASAVMTGTGEKPRRQGRRTNLTGSLKLRDN